MYGPSDDEERRWQREHKQTRLRQQQALEDLRALLAGDPSPSDLARARDIIERALNPKPVAAWAQKVANAPTYRERPTRADVGEHPDEEPYLGPRGWYGFDPYRDFPF